MEACKGVLVLVLVGGRRFGRIRDRKLKEGRWTFSLLASSDESSPSEGANATMRQGHAGRPGKCDARVRRV